MFSVEHASPMGPALMESNMQASYLVANQVPQVLASTLLMSMHQALCSLSSSISKHSIFRTCTQQSALLATTLLSLDHHCSSSIVLLPARPPPITACIWQLSKMGKEKKAEWRNGGIAEWTLLLKPAHCYYCFR